MLASVDFSNVSDKHWNFVLICFSFVFHLHFHFLHFLLHLLNDENMASRFQNNNSHIDQKLQALILYEKSIAIKIVQIITEISIRTIYDLRTKTRRREYDSSMFRILKIEYVENVFRSNRFFTIISTLMTIILINVRQNRHDREKFSIVLNYDYEMSFSIIFRVMR